MRVHLILPINNNKQKIGAFNSVKGFGRENKRINSAGLLEDKY